MGETVKPAQPAMAQCTQKIADAKVGPTRRLDRWRLFVAIVATIIALALLLAVALTTLAPAEVDMGLAKRAWKPALSAVVSMALGGSACAFYVRRASKRKA